MNASQHPRATRLVLIQGTAMAQYVGRKQGPVIRFEYWDEHAAAFIEPFRQGGMQAVEAYEKAATA